MEKDLPYSKSVPLKYKKNLHIVPKTELKNLKNIDTYIVTTKSNSGAPVDNPFGKTPVIFVDGNDIGGDHTIPKYCDTAYIREYLL